MTLRLDWCSREAAKYAVEHWHYSRTLPACDLVTIGAWEGGQYVGAIIFGRGGSLTAYKWFGANQTNACELTRIAMRSHAAPITRMVAVALRMLRRRCPGLSFVFSYADWTVRGHVGAIYQAGNWLYLGESQSSRSIVNGSVLRKRTLSSRGGVALRNRGTRITWTRPEVKHRYAYPFREPWISQLRARALPYPKRATGVDGDTPAVHAGVGGSSPTVALVTGEGT